MKVVQTKVIDELFLIFFINYFIIVFLFNVDFFTVLINNLINNSEFILLFNLFFFAVPKKKSTKKKKIKGLLALIKFLPKTIFKLKLNRNLTTKEDTTLLKD
jgi:hypothetical protein